MTNNHYYSKRQLSKDHQDMAHALEDIRKLEVKESEIRTKKRVLYQQLEAEEAEIRKEKRERFQDLMNIEDNLVRREMEAKRRLDESGDI
jgi:hypothetical protein